MGGGFGGLRAARALSRHPVDVTLVDRTNHHLFQPLLYQVATGVLSGGQIAPALRSLFRHRPSVRVLLAQVQGFDLQRRLVHAVAESPLAIPYDTLIVAAGATHCYFGREAWRTLAPGLKTLDDAARLRSRILGAFEMAEHAAPGPERDGWLTFTVVGAGPTGVELAGQLSVLARRILRGEYRGIDPAGARIVLLDGGSSVLHAFAEPLRSRAQRDLRRLGIEIRLNARAVQVDSAGIDVDGPAGRERIPARTVIWAAGVQASPLAAGLAQASGAECDSAGRLRVAADLSVPGHPEVFAIGDMAAVPGVPGAAQAAMQQGHYVGRVIAARLGRAPAPPRFRYRDRGSMAVIGRLRAVADLPGFRVAGPLAFLLWGVVHLNQLTNNGGRLEVLSRWLRTVIGRSRRERLVTALDLEKLPRPAAAPARAGPSPPPARARP